MVWSGVIGNPHTNDSYDDCNTKQDRYQYKFVYHFVVRNRC